MGVNDLWIMDFQKKEINERKRREAESDDTNLVDGFDSLASGMKPDEIKEYREGLIKECLSIEDAE